jgi:DNA-binding transcriptional LysR family regulator
VIEPRRPRVLRALGVLVGVVLLGTVVGWLADVVYPTTTVERTFSLAPGPSRLSVETTNGVVRLTSTPGRVVQVHRRVTHGWREAAIEERTDESGATLRGTCPSVFARSCAVDYDIAVPDRFTVELRASSGDLDVRGISAERLRTDVSSGRTTLVDVAGSVEVRASSGSVTATRLSSADVTAEVSSGSTSLDFATAPSTVTVSASSGSVTVRLPDDGPYRVRADSTSGQEQVGVRVDPASSRAVTVNVSSGDVAVLPR